MFWCYLFFLFRRLSPAFVISRNAPVYLRYFLPQFQHQLLHPGALSPLTVEHNDVIVAGISFDLAAVWWQRRTLVCVGQPMCIQICYIVVCSHICTCLLRVRSAKCEFIWVVHNIYNFLLSAFFPFICFILLLTFLDLYKVPHFFLLLLQKACFFLNFKFSCLLFICKKSIDFCILDFYLATPL